MEFIEWISVHDKEVETVEGKQVVRFDTWTIALQHLSSNSIKSSVMVFNDKTGDKYVAGLDEVAFTREGIEGEFAGNNENRPDGFTIEELTS